MFNIFLKYFCIFGCSLYTSFKLLNKQPNILTLIFQSILLAFSVLLTHSIFPNQHYVLPLTFYLCMNFKNQKYIRPSFIASTFAYTFSYTLLMLCTFITSSIIYLLHFQNNPHSIFVAFLLSCPLTLFLHIKLFKIPRFRSGMPFIFQKVNNIFGLSLALTLLSANIYVHLSPIIYHNTSALIQLLACLLLIPFIAWWRSQLTKSYRQYLKDAETQELRAKVEQLTADNQRLSQIVHKDNKLITAMTSSVLTFVEEIPDYSPEHLSAYSRTLHQELLSLSTHRQDSLSRLSGTVTGQFHTGYMMLDSVLNLQAKQAREYNITFSAESNKDFFAKIFSTIDEEQLTHIVADLVQNAIIATKDAPYKSVDISFVTGPQVPSIQISDTGSPFPAVVLNNLGQERCSQHLQDGGSGIGLMDIWALKNTAKATLLIEEFPDGAKFTKRIHLIFDNKNRYLIMSDRKDELSSQLHRPDVILLSSSH